MKRIEPISFKEVARAESGVGRRVGEEGKRRGY